MTNDQEHLAALLEEIGNKLKHATITVQGLHVSATSGPGGGSVTGMSVSAVGGSGSGTVIGLRASAGIYANSEAQSVAPEFETVAREVREGRAKGSTVFRLLGIAVSYVGKVLDAGTVAAAEEAAKRVLG